MLKILGSFSTSAIAALLLSLGLMFWVNPTTQDGDIALVLVAFLFFTLILRIVVFVLRKAFAKPASP